MKKRKVKKKAMGGIMMRGTRIFKPKRGKGAYRRDNHKKYYPDDFFTLEC